MDRVVADCRDFPSESGCTLTISGTEPEVLAAATQHAIAVHGHTAGPELDAAVKGMLRPE